MPYKDKDKQREAVRLATQRYRQRLKVSQSKPLVIPGAMPDVIPRDDREIVPFCPKLQSYNPMMVGYVPPID